MRAIVALASALLSSPSLADTVRHASLPERLWGKWAPSPDLCRDDKAFIVLSAKAYVSPDASCAIRWVTETAGARGPIYSAHMQCSKPTSAQRKTETNLIMTSNDDGQLSVGADFKSLKIYERCPNSADGMN
jgi:hypothetical protein